MSDFFENNRPASASPATINTATRLNQVV